MSHTNLALGANWDGEWPEYVEVSHEGADDGRRYVPERTCRNRADDYNKIIGKGTYGFVCSECGYNEPMNDVLETLCLQLFDASYCRSCGAEVVEDD